MRRKNTSVTLTNNFNLIYAYYNPNDTTDKVLDCASLNRIPDLSLSPSSILILPTSKQVDALKRAYAEKQRLPQMPRIYTLSGVVKEIAKALDSKAKILSAAEAETLLAMSTGRATSFGSVLSARQIIRWKQDGIGLENARQTLAVDDPRFTHEFQRLIDEWSLYEGGKGLSHDPADLTQWVTHQLNGLSEFHLPIKGAEGALNELIVLCTHGVAELDRELLHALAGCGWTLGVQMYSDPAGTQRSTEAQLWFTLKGWETVERNTMSEPDFTTVLREWPSRTEEIRRVFAWIKSENISLDEVCLVLPSNSNYNTIIENTAMFSGVPLHKGSAIDLGSTRISGIFRKRISDRLSGNSDSISAKEFFEDLVNPILKEMQSVENFDGIDAAAALAGVRSFESKSFTAVLNVCRQYALLHELYGLPKVFPEKHSVWLFELLKHTQLNVPHSPLQGLRVETAAGLRMQSWKYVFCVGFVDGEFPVRRRRGAEDFLQPDNALVLDKEWFFDMRGAVMEGGFLFCSRPIHLDSDDTLPSAFWVELQESGTVVLPNARVGFEVLDNAEMQFALHATELPAKEDNGIVLLERQLGQILQGDKENAESAHREVTRRAISPSRLDTVSSCTYKYYARYLLKLEVEEESENSLSPIDRGNLMHEVAREFYTRFGSQEVPSPTSVNDVLQSQVRLPDLHLDQLYAELFKVYQSVRKKYKVDFLYHDVEELMMIDTEERAGLLKRWLATELDVQQSSNFYPTYFEVELDSEITLPNGDVERVKLKVDRIDTQVVGNQVWFVVIDYKTGSGSTKKKSEIAEGNASQMPLYLMAVEAWLERGGVKAVPAGAAYRTFGRSVKSDVDPTQKIVMGTKTMLQSTEDEQLFVVQHQLDEARIPLPEKIARMRGTAYPVMPLARACRYCSYNDLCRREDWKTKQV